jgi:hypothetical protein
MSKKPNFKHADLCLGCPECTNEPLMTAPRAAQDGTGATGVAGGVEVTGDFSCCLSKRIPSPLPKHPTADDVYFIGGAWAPACITAQDKRFMDAELVAEYWKVLGGLYDGHGKKARARRETLQRFATLPHYDEERA